ncbi:MAG: hypothetical protein HYV35_02170 [Lentisphaerae bacterium]|nr:hypothetical protein [Lentisphaerota bacterium]
MIEPLINAILLALHNLALVGCAAAPFYNRNLVLMRAQYGPKLHFELDKVVEDTLQGNAPWCLAFLAILWITGIGMPLNHLVFQGALKVLHPIGMTAMLLKLACVCAMMVIMGMIFFRINPRLRALFAAFSPGVAPAPEREREFFSLRARRKALCETCLKFAIGVLICSAFIGFHG